MKRIRITFFIFLLLPCGLKAQRYVLYGEAAQGGQFNHGTLFRFNPFTGKDTVLYNFNGNDGDTPARSLYLTPNKILYGGCELGGSKNDGVLFSYNLSNGNENTLVDFIDSNGTYPFLCPLISNSFLYGTTGYGGVFGGGVIFRYNLQSNQDSVVFNFNDTDGAVSYGGLFMLNDTSFYGITGEGGKYNGGTIYRFNPKTNKEITLYSFKTNTDGNEGQGTFIKDSNGLLYGMTSDLGPGGGGVLFSFNPVANTETDLVDFSDSLGLYPFGDLLLATDSLLYGMTALGGSNNHGVLFSYNVKTNTYTIVNNFDSIHGTFGAGGHLIEDTINKLLYGITLYGGGYNDGVIFSYNLITKKYSVLLNFDGANGANPQGTLLLVDSATALGMPQLSKVQTEINVYPNPNNGNFTIEYNVGNTTNCKVELYSTLGEVVGEYTLGNSEGAMNISNPMLANGVYIWKIYANKQVLKYGKVIIMK